MLHDFGVKGVKIQEVISLDEELLAFIPRPIFGLIFLFRWSEEDPNKQEQSCPEGVWFANQNEATSRKRKRAVKGNIDESEAGYHFIAYVPVGDSLWKLDGLDRQPEKLANIDGGDWVLKAKPDLEARMVGREGANDFAVMSLVEDPLTTLIPTLAENVAAVQAITKHLQSIKPSSEGSLSPNNCEDPSEDFLVDLDPSYGLDQGIFDKALVSTSTMKILQSSDYSDIIRHKFELLAAQGSIRSSIKEEQESRRSDQQRASRRRHDIEPLSAQLLHALSRQSPKQDLQKKTKRRRK
ncbi:MAG: hypothetical protein Q9191_000282 [Dirinaria sp. TL-2023a]